MGRRDGNLFEAKVGVYYGGVNLLKLFDRGDFQDFLTLFSSIADIPGKAETVRCQFADNRVEK